MKITDILKKDKPSISYEIFPPNEKFGIETIYSTIEELKELDPSFMSVTFGAGGTGGGRVVEISSKLKHDFNIEPLAHLTCIGSSKEDVTKILAELNDNDVKNILALRGDPPKSGEVPNSEFKHAVDLISRIKDSGDYCIGGAVYPEGHPETNDLLDLYHLKNKVDAGVDFLVSQMFFDNEMFYRFKDNADKLQIDVPMIAGIMPVTNAKQIDRIISMCKATLSPKFKRILDKYGDDPASLQEAGTAFCIEQIIDLLTWGIDGVHIYTMNRSETAKKIHQNICSIRTNG